MFKKLKRIILRTFGTKEIDNMKDRIDTYLMVYYQLMSEYKIIKTDHEEDEICGYIYSKSKIYKEKAELVRRCTKQEILSQPTCEKILDTIKFIDKNTINEDAVGAGHYEFILQDIVNLFGDDKYVVQLIMKLELLGKINLTDRLKQLLT